MLLEMPDMKLPDDLGIGRGLLFSWTLLAEPSDLSMCFLETELPFFI
jgi:hypothetical protein